MIYKSILNEKFNNNATCHFCGKTGDFDFVLCDDCLELARKKMLYLKNGQWQFEKDRVINKLLKNNFFDPQKEYKTKDSLFTKNEKILYEVLLYKLDNNKYIALPQINLQTIIETDSKERNDELYRNIDFCIFEKETFKPVLAIELNGLSHKNNNFVKKRDESVKQILTKANLPFLIFDNDDLYNMTTEQIYNLIKKSLPNKKN